ncbi:hypothetical protein D9M71_751600 [compost metagenome]
MTVARKESGTALGAQGRDQTFLGLLGLFVFGRAQAWNQIQLGHFLQLYRDVAAIGRAVWFAVSGVWGDFLFPVLLGSKKHGEFAMMAERITVFEQRTGQCPA